MVLGSLYAQLRRLIEINSIRVLAAVIGMLHDAGHPAFSSPECVLDLNEMEETAIAAVDLSPTQADIVAMYSIGYFSGEFRDITCDYPDYLCAAHTIGEWVGWEAAIRDITGYGVGRFAEIRALIWREAVPFGQSGPNTSPSIGMWQVQDPSTIGGGWRGHSPTWTPLGIDQPEHTSVPELIDLAIAALKGAQYALEKVICAPDRPARSVASYTMLTDLVVDLTRQSQAVRQG
jgi:hypothetical protein